ncbi:MAG: hydrogenase nickel incorporation protein HypA [Desulfurococcaceae archaeon]
MVHEWALAESIILYLLSNKYFRVKELRIRIGALQSIDKDILEFGIKELSGENNISINNIVFEDEQPVLKCNTCGHEWAVNPEELGEHIKEAIHFIPESIYAFVKCPKCSSVDYQVVKGRGISKIEVVLND